MYKTTVQSEKLKAKGYDDYKLKIRENLKEIVTQGFGAFVVPLVSNCLKERKAAIILN